jgi:Skp family chaperone for outer membrane proteins
MNNKWLKISLVVLILGAIFFYVCNKLDCYRCSTIYSGKNNVTVGRDSSAVPARTAAAVSGSGSVVADNKVGDLSDGLSIAIVDIDRVASGSMAGKSIERQMVEINNKSEKVFSDLEAKVKKAESKQTSPESGRKVEDINALLYELVRDRRQQIIVAYNAALATLKENINTAIAEVSQRKNIKLVVRSEVIIYHTADFQDITSDVIETMNSICGKIVVKSEKKKLADAEKLKDFSELSDLANFID